MGAFGWPHLLIILAVILLLFGAAKLPALAKSMGQSARVFRGEMKAMKDENVESAASTDGAAPAQRDDVIVNRSHNESDTPPRSS